MKALDEYFLMAVFTLLLNSVHVFANFMFNVDRNTWQQRVKVHYYASVSGHDHTNHVPPPTLFVHWEELIQIYMQIN